MEIYRCLHQVSERGVKISKYMREGTGIGECVDCVFNPYENPNCAGYSPVKIFIVDSENLAKEVSTLEKTFQTESVLKN